MEKVVTIDFKHALWQLLNRTRHLVYKNRMRELKDNGVSYNNAMILYTALRLGKGATPAQISRGLSLERHTVSESLIKMENEGLIRRIKDLSRKNLIRIEVTDKGFEVYRRSANRESTKGIMSVLAREEQYELWRLLAKVRDEAARQLGLKFVDMAPPSDPPESYFDEV